MQNLCNEIPQTSLDCFLTPESALVASYRDFEIRNGMAPLYFVCSPRDWHMIQMLLESNQVNNFIQGVPVIVSPIVPDGEAKFVG